MKKISFMAFAAIMAIVMASCNQTRPPKADVKNDIDSLSYSIGNSIASQLKDYGVLKERYDVDSAYYSDFLRGMTDAFNAGEDKAKIAYFVGLQIGLELNRSYLSESEKIYFFDDDEEFFTPDRDTTKSFSRDNFLAAIYDVFNNKKPLITPDEMAKINSDFQMLMPQKARAYKEYEQSKVMEEKYGENRKAGEKFLEENKKKAGVLTTESGLQYKVLTQGTGKVPTADQKVKVHYEGRLIDGTVFDSSIERGEPAEFPLNAVIPGWTEALSMMPVGSEWEIYIPQNLAYGAQDRNVIKPFSALIFKVKLLDIVE